MANMEQAEEEKYLHSNIVLLKAITKIYIRQPANIYILI